MFKSDCGMVFITTYVVLILSSVSVRQHLHCYVSSVVRNNLLSLLMLTKKYNQLEDAYKYFIRNSGLDCGSFMAYSFFHGYIKFVVATNGDTSSKGKVVINLLLDV